MVKAFDADYQRHVVPLLVRAIRLEAALAARGVYTFVEAVGNVMCMAVWYGAGELSADAFAQLEHWVLDQVADCLEAELQ